MDRQSHSRDSNGRRRQNRSREGSSHAISYLRVPPQADNTIVALQNIIEINRPPVPVYQSVIEKTRGLAFRTQAVGAAIEKTVLEKAAQNSAAVQPAVVEGAR